MKAPELDDQQAPAQPRAGLVQHLDKDNSCRRGCSCLRTQQGIFCETLPPQCHGEAGVATRRHVPQDPGIVSWQTGCRLLTFDHTMHRAQLAIDPALGNSQGAVVAGHQHATVQHAMAQHATVQHAADNGGRLGQGSEEEVLRRSQTTESPAARHQGRRIRE